MTRTAQTRLIEEHLREKGSITPLEALEQYGCFRLAARIADLRREGLPILTNIVERNEKRFASYVLA